VSCVEDKSKTRILSNVYTVDKIGVKIHLL